MPMQLRPLCHTNSICQGQQVPIIWPLIFERGIEIAFAHTSFKWSNLGEPQCGGDCRHRWHIELERGELRPILKHDDGDSSKESTT